MRVAPEVGVTDIDVVPPAFLRDILQSDLIEASSRRHLTALEY
jgi:hypothetical protein